MVRILLDTQILLWWLGNDQKLKPSVRRHIKEADQTFVSTISFWEMVIKEQLNKLTVPRNVQQLVLDQNFTILTFESAHAFAVRRLPLLHGDPFDRALMGQAKSEDLSFVTYDDTIINNYDQYLAIYNARKPPKANTKN